MAALLQGYRTFVEDDPVRNEQPRLQVNQKGGLGDLIGQSPAMQAVFAVIHKVAPTSACVLITGESGSGKELAARAIHKLSPRADGPFVAINCAAMPESLMESELFGHEKGAFTGALQRRLGCFELATDGTLLLDEIGDMPIGTQAKLLRVLEDSRVRRLGGRFRAARQYRLVVGSVVSQGLRHGGARAPVHGRRCAGEAGAGAGAAEAPRCGDDVHARVLREHCARRVHGTAVHRGGTSIGGCVR
jgi:DNA-binding NtrC family response regulator